MSEKYKFRDPEGIYFVSPTIVYWIDLFTKKIYCEIIVDSLQYCQKEKELCIHAWCIMSSHLHLIISSKSDLSGIMRDFKTHTSKSIIKKLCNGIDSRKEWLLKMFSSSGEKLRRIDKFKVWQDGNHPVLLETNEMIDQRLTYLHNNPVASGIVVEPEHYYFSSAIDYAGGTGLIKVEKIE